MGWLRHCGCLLWLVDCRGWLPTPRFGAWQTRVFSRAVAAVLLPHQSSIPRKIDAQVLVHALFWFRQSFGLVLIHSFIAMDTMDSIAPDWFWFCLPLIVLVLRRAAPSLSDLLLYLPLHTSPRALMISQSPTTSLIKSPLPTVISME